MAAKSREAGFTAHLTKPIRKATLLEALASFSAPEVPAPQPAEPAEQLVVKVEKGMEEIVPSYLEKRRKDVDIYRKALAGGDFDALRMLAHRMKGNRGGVRVPGLVRNRKRH